MKRIAIAGLALMVTACGPTAAPLEEPKHDGAIGAGAKHGINYAGRWAASLEACPTAWLDFGSDQVRLADDMRCIFQRENPIPGGIEIDMACVGVGLSSVERWTMTKLPEGGMSLMRNNEVPQSLQRCPSVGE